MELKDFYITCPHNVEELAGKEAESLGAQDIRAGKGGFHLKGTIKTAYTLCLRARTINRIFLPLVRFKVEKKEDVYRAANFFTWNDHFDENTTFSIDADCRHDEVNNNSYAALLVKDGIADYFRNLYGERPTVDTEDPDIKIHLYLDKEEGTLSLDLTGESLHKRGYRVTGGKASLKENVAAAILMRGGWAEMGHEGKPLVDPMCGSGTFLIEGALIAGGIPPGVYRQSYGFQKWKQHDENIWSGLYFDALKDKKAGLKKLPRIIGFDADPEAIKGAEKNLRMAGLWDHITISTGDITLAAPEAGMDKGLFVTNPPYGERLGEKEKVGVLYEIIGDTLKSKFQDWKALILAGDEDLSKATGLRAIKTNSINNGPLKCVLAHFEVSENYFFKNYNTPEEPENSDFANRIKKNLKQRKKWAEKNGVTCYRLYDADLQEYAAAIDFYENKWVTIQEYAAPPTIEKENAERRMNHMVKVLPTLLNIPFQNLYIKERKQQKGSEQYNKQGDKGLFHIVNEGGLKFRVNFEDYLDTGLFLNSRKIRELIRKKAKGKHFLNLFSYTASATVYAAAGGAASTISVDVSNTYNDWGKENMLLNNLTPHKNHFKKEDTFTFLKECRGKFDLIFLDPPTFSNNKKKGLVFDLQRDYLAMVRLCLNRLVPGGELIFSNNFKKFIIDEEEIKENKEVEIKDIGALTLPEDFKGNDKMHNCWLITKETVRGEQGGYNYYAFDKSKEERGGRDGSDRDYRELREEKTSDRYNAQRDRGFGDRDRGNKDNRRSGNRNREDRNNRGFDNRDQGDRNKREFSDRGDRNNRGFDNRDRGDRNNRGFDNRDRGDRNNRGFDNRDRGDRNNRGFGDRDRGDRNNRGFGDRDRGDRNNRGFGDRDRGDRNNRGFNDRDRGDRNNRGFSDYDSADRNNRKFDGLDLSDKKNRLIKNQNSHNVDQETNSSDEQNYKGYGHRDHRDRDNRDQGDRNNRGFKGRDRGDRDNRGYNRDRGDRGFRDQKRRYSENTDRKPENDLEKEKYDRGFRERNIRKKRARSIRNRENEASNDDKS